MFFSCVSCANINNNNKHIIKRPFVFIYRSDRIQSVLDIKVVAQPNVTWCLFWNIYTSVQNFYERTTIIVTLSESFFFLSWLKFQNHDFLKDLISQNLKSFQNQSSDCYEIAINWFKQISQLITNTNETNWISQHSSWPWKTTHWKHCNVPAFSAETP